jgi:hypothetical protein
MIWFMSNFLGSLQQLTLGHTNVPYKLCELNWRGLRFGYRDEIPGQAGDDGNPDFSA